MYATNNSFFFFFKMTNLSRQLSKSSFLKKHTWKSSRIEKGEKTWKTQIAKKIEERNLGSLDVIRKPSETIYLYFKKFNTHLWTNNQDHLNVMEMNSQMTKR